MNEKRILKKIETAHHMGFDVFAIDAGWFKKTSDRVTSKIRFPDQLKTIKKRLTEYCMNLGSVEKIEVPKVLNLSAGELNDFGKLRGSAYQSIID